jgi:hypothetical protein
MIGSNNIEVFEGFINKLLLSFLWLTINSY